MAQTCSKCGQTGHNARTCSVGDNRFYPVATATNMTKGMLRGPFAAATGIPSIVDDTEDMRKDAHYDTVFDLYDDMVKFDPELNGAVRSVSLTANNWDIDYRPGKNAAVRDSIRELVEQLDFDDILINCMRNLMVYGNDINKLVGKAGTGISAVQSLPITQITIVDERNPPFQADEDNPVIEAKWYWLREGKRDPMAFPSNEILHVKIDYRSNWYKDKKLRWTYGIWGASRFSSLKQPIRAKYNSINNRTALEDSLTKQFVTINQEAVEHIIDPNEQRERLVHIMDEVAKLLEGLRGDQIPILPHYVEMHHVDLKNTVPDNSAFLDSVNADIAAVLNVPRVAAGQERGSTFAATFNANMWSVSAIKRLQSVVEQAMHNLFVRHLNLQGIRVEARQIPRLVFNPMEDESRFEKMRRAVMGYGGGILTLNQSLDILGFPPVADGDERKSDLEQDSLDNQNMGDLPRENEQEGVQESKGGDDE
jgi:hypothetical protein